MLQVEIDVNNKYTDLRSGLSMTAVACVAVFFRFLLAGEAQSQGEVTQIHPPATNFLLPLSPCPCATPTCLKGNGKDCYAGYEGCNS